VIRGRAHRRLRILRHRWSNAVQLVGWSRLSGPRTAPGAVVRPRSGGSAETVPVVLCVWRRPERLARTIDLLRDQTGVKPSLYVWNNNPRARSVVDEAVAGAADIEVKVVHSARNAGGFGRFYLAREVAQHHPYVIFVDDDQTFDRTAIADFVGEFRPETISGFWAFRFTEPSDYWARVPATPGERVDFCATCGMVCDTRIFLKPDLFRCPRRFWFIEDLWLSYIADHVLGWKIFKSAVELDVDEDGLDQYHYLYDLKSRLLAHLVEAGWDLPRPSSTLANNGHAS
jgi:hypothetical protein